MSASSGASVVEYISELTGEPVDFQTHHTHRTLNYMFVKHSSDPTFFDPGKIKIALDERDAILAAHQQLLAQRAASAAQGPARTAASSAFVNSVSGAMVNRASSAVAEVAAAVEAQAARAASSAFAHTSSGAIARAASSAYTQAVSGGLSNTAAKEAKETAIDEVKTASAPRVQAVHAASSAFANSVSGGIANAISGAQAQAATAIQAQAARAASSAFANIVSGAVAQAASAPATNVTRKNNSTTNTRNTRKNSAAVNARKNSSATNVRNNNSAVNTRNITNIKKLREICGNLGKPNIDGSLRVYTKDECENQLKGTWHLNGECTKKGGGDWSSSCGKILNDALAKSITDNGNFAKMTDLEEIRNNIQALKVSTAGNGDSISQLGNINRGVIQDIMGLKNQYPQISDAVTALKDAQAKIVVPDTSKLALASDVQAVKEAQNRFVTEPDLNTLRNSYESLMTTVSKLKQDIEKIVIPDTSKFASILDLQALNSSLGSKISAGSRFYASASELQQLKSVISKIRIPDTSTFVQASDLEEVKESIPDTSEFVKISDISKRLTTALKKPLSAINMKIDELNTAISELQESSAQEGGRRRDRTRKQK